MIFKKKTFADYSLLLRQRTPQPQVLQEKTFTIRHKTAKFAKVFSLKSFPLYGIYNSLHARHCCRVRLHDDIDFMHSCHQVNTMRHTSYSSCPHTTNSCGYGFPALPSLWCLAPSWPRPGGSTMFSSTPTDARRRERKWVTIDTMGLSFWPTHILTLH